MQELVVTINQLNQQIADIGNNMQLNMINSTPSLFMPSRPPLDIPYLLDKGEARKKLKDDVDILTRILNSSTEYDFEKKKIEVDNIKRKHIGCISSIRGLNGY